MKSTEIRLPKITDEIYKEIGEFKEYEMSQCIAYEFAIRDPQNLQEITDFIEAYEFDKDKPNQKEYINLDKSKPNQNERMHRLSPYGILAKETLYIEDNYIAEINKFFFLDVSIQYRDMYNNGLRDDRFITYNRGRFNSEAILYVDKRIDRRFYEIFKELEAKTKAKDKAKEIRPYYKLSKIDEYKEQIKFLQNITKQNKCFGMELAIKSDIRKALKIEEIKNKKLDKWENNQVKRQDGFIQFTQNELINDLYGKGTTDISITNIHKIYPDYKRPRLYDNSINSQKASVEMDFSRPKKELEAYIKNIIDNKSIKSPFELITDEVGEIALDDETAKSEIWKKMFFIYDYIEAKYKNMYDEWDRIPDGEPKIDYRSENSIIKGDPTLEALIDDIKGRPKQNKARAVHKFYKAIKTIIENHKYKEF